jgi:hypothetical protein
MHGLHGDNESKSTPLLVVMNGRAVSGCDIIAPVMKYIDLSTARLQSECGLLDTVAMSH